MFSGRSRYGWSLQSGALALLMMALGVLATFDAWADILLIARKDEEAGHILLVPFVVAWLVLVRRSRLARCPVRPSIIGPVFIGIGWAMSSIGFRHSIQSMWHLGAVIVVAGCLLSVLGKELLGRFLPAFVALVFLVPVPGRLRQRMSVPLMTTTAIVTKDVSDILGVPAERHGNQLSVNGEPITIVEACNGLRMVFALMLVCYAFAFSQPLRNYVRLIIIAATPLSAIACNVMRLVPTAWVYGYAGKQAGNRFHDASAWVMLGIAFLLLLGIVRVLRWALIPVTRYTLAWEY